jgi:hypothetical protein
LQQEYLALVQGAYRQPNRDDVLRAVKRLEREGVFLQARLRPVHVELSARLEALRRSLPALARRADRDVAGAVAEVGKAFQELEDIHARLGGRVRHPEDTTGLLAAPA